MERLGGMLEYNILIFVFFLLLSVIQLPCTFRFSISLSPLPHCPTPLFFPSQSCSWIALPTNFSAFRPLSGFVFTSFRHNHADGLLCPQNETTIALQVAATPLIESFISSHFIEPFQHISCLYSCLYFASSICKSFSTYFAFGETGRNA